MNRYWRAACALALLGGAAAAQACDKKMQVLAVMTDMVGTYDLQGNLQGDISKDKIVMNAPVVNCNASPALVEVKLKQATKDDPPTAWVNMLEVKIGEEGVKSSKPKCKTDSVSHLADTAAPATSGIGSCSSDAE